MTKDHHPMEDQGNEVEDDFMRYAAKVWTKSPTNLFDALDITVWTYNSICY